ncbi:MAG: hypothetical protein AAF827_18280 [Cyanobacteria bacterium P01_D01_bin.6]
MTDLTDLGYSQKFLLTIAGARSTDSQVFLGSDRATFGLRKWSRTLVKFWNHAIA